MTNVTLPFLGIGVPALLALAVGLWLVFRPPKQNKFVFQGVGAVLAFLGITGGALAGMNLGGFSVAGTGSTTTTTPTTGGAELVADSIQVSLSEKGSNSFANLDDVSVYFYVEGTNPKGANIAPVTWAEIDDGQGNVIGTTDGLIKGNRKYRVVVTKNGTSYYSIDCGDIVVFSDNNFNPTTGDANVDLDEKCGKLTLFGTVTEITGSELTNATVGGALRFDGGNFNTNCTENSAELCSAEGASGAGTADLLQYDESAGDGTYTLIVTVENSGAAYTELRDANLCFEFDPATPAEGTEITGIQAALRTGTSLNLASQWVDYWRNEQCVSVGTIPSGQTSDYTLTFTVSEANYEAGDDWYMVLDDLGPGRLPRDADNRAGATRDRVQFDTVA